MWLWRKGRIGGEVKVVDALVRRRAAEIALFLTHPSGPAPVPGALVRPLQEQNAGLPAAPAEPERTVIIEARQPAAPGPGSAPRPGAAPPPLSPQQAAARAVGERLARILGDLPPESADRPPAAEPGPSVEEITRAIADLAGPAEEAAAVLPKGPPDGIERRRGLRPADTEPPHLSVPIADSDPPMLPMAPSPDLPLPPAEAYMVDDLAPAAIDEASLRRAIQENGHSETHRNGAESLGRWLPFALLSGLGLVGLFAGVQRFIALAANAPVSQNDVWLGPLLALGGGFLFVIATYYLYRAMTQQD
jgi:lysozyme